jgi:hypothetical protein
MAAPSFIRATSTPRAEVLGHLVRRYLSGRTLPEIVNGIGLDPWLMGFTGDQTQFPDGTLARRLGCATTPAWCGEVAATLRVRLVEDHNIPSATV